MKTRFFQRAAFLAAALVFAAAAPSSARSPYRVSENALTAREIADALLGAGVVVEPAGTANLIGGGSNASGIRSFSGFEWVYTNETGRIFQSFTNGIVFSTGYASGGSVSAGTNTSAAASTVSQVWPVVVADSDLAREFPFVGALGDAAGVVFYIRPQHATLNIPLFVASEEYFLNSGWWDERSSYDDFSDCFAFFLSKWDENSGPSGSFEPFTNNIARLPSGDPISIGDVNPFKNTEYFVANVETNEWEDLLFPTTNIPIPMEYNGAILGPTAVATNMVPGDLYAIKIVVADGGNDSLFDTAVFLKAKGITSGADLKLTVSVDPESLPDVGDGDTATFTFKVENVGPAPAWGVTLTNAVPASPDGAWSWSAPEVWNLPDLASGASFTTNLVVSFTDLAAAYPGLTVTGVVATATGDYDMSNNSDSATVSFAGTATVSATKVWADAGDQDGIRPSSVTFSLYANGSKVEDASVSAADGWAKTWSGLPKVDNGALIDYDVREDAVPDGYSLSIVTNGLDFTLANTHIPATVAVTAQKVWDDANDQDGLRPPSVTFALSSNGVEVATASVSESTGWAASWEGLAERAAGTAVAWTVSEPSAPQGYTASVSQNGSSWTVTNKHTPAVVTVTAQKVWDDADDQDGLRPDSATLSLYADGVKVEDFAATSTAPSNTWTDLPKFAAGQEIAYEVRENSVPADYAAAVTHTGYAWTVTNKHVPATVSVTAQKVWDDANDQDGIRPSSVTFALSSNGVEVATAGVSASTGWAASWGGLSENSAGAAIAWTVAEPSAPSGYTASVSNVSNDWTITNTHTPTVTVTAQKVWEDDNNRDGLRPETVTFALFSNGVEVATAAVSASTGWAASWEGLAERAAGTAIAWTVAEPSVPSGYAAAVTHAGNDWTVTNTHEIERVTITATKVWNDANDQDGIRPASATLSLYADGVKVEDFAATVATPSKTWTGLAKRSAGTLIAYEVREDIVPTGYTNSITHVGDVWTVTNTHEPETVDVTATKVWDDEDNRDGYRPASATLSLYADGVKVEDFASTVAAPSKTWTGLAKRSAGTLITYEIREDSVPAGYTNSITHVGDVWTVTNTHEHDTIDITVTKVWDDANNQDGIRPNSVDLTLHDPWGAVIQTVTAADNWTYTWTGLRKWAGPNVGIAYRVEEWNPPEGYTASRVDDGNNNWTVTNTHVPETVDVTATKVWNDADNQDGIRPASATLSLYADGVKVEDFAATVAAPSKTWTGLAKRSAGTLIAYEVREDIVPTGYTNSITHVGDVWTVTNTHEPETVDVTATKVWDDADDQDGIRPDSAVLSFYENGVWVEDFTATEAMPSNTWAGLPKYASGVEIRYEIHEDSVPAGYTKSETRNGNAWTITNIHEPETLSVSATNVWDDADNQDGKRPSSVLLSLYKSCPNADGVKVEDFAATVATPSKTWTGLAKRSAGTLITYEIREDSVPAGYTASITHAGDFWTVTNKYVPETVSVTARKIWNDSNDKDKLRPASATLSLYADGVKREDFAAMASGASKTWTGLPKYAAGRLVSYTVRELSVPAGYTASVSQSGTTWTITNTHVVGSPKLQVSVVWTLSRSDGLFHGSITVKNAGNLAFPLAANYWLATPGSRPTWYLYNPTGKLPDGSDYYNLTAAVQAAVKSVGNRNTVLDPGESVTVTGPLMYHKQRINPSKYLATTAFHGGTLVSPYDTNRDFKISASELSAAESKWKAGSVSDADVLLVSLLNASPAYLWSDSASSLVGCADKR